MSNIQEHQPSIASIVSVATETAILVGGGSINFWSSSLGPDAGSHPPSGESSEVLLSIYQSD